MNPEFVAGKLVEKEPNNSFQQAQIDLLLPLPVAKLKRAAHA
jgi:hypothetical protein